MTSPSHHIVPLSSQDILRIRSSAQISSLGDVVKSLLKNSLDAGATTVRVTCDFHNGGCVVEDNGCGISASEFKEDGGLFKAHWTSKSQAVGLHGRSGTALSSIAAFSVTTVISRDFQSQELNSITSRFSEVRRVRVPAPSRRELQIGTIGTRVIVRNLFGNVPVRANQRPSSDTPTSKLLDWKLLKSDIIAMLLAWNNPVNLSLLDETGDLLLDTAIPTAKSMSLLNHSSQTHMQLFDRERLIQILKQSSSSVHDSENSWVPLSASASSVSLKGLISVDAAPNRQCQFISMGITPLEPGENSSSLFDEINNIFSKSQFGTVQDDTSKTEAEKRKSLNLLNRRMTDRFFASRHRDIDRCPMFHLQIFPRGYQGRYVDTELELLDDAKFLERVLKIIRITIVQWLEKHGFEPQVCNVKRKRDKDGLNPFVASPVPGKMYEFTPRTASFVSEVSNFLASFSRMKTSRPSSQAMPQSRDKSEKCTRNSVNSSDVMSAAGRISPAHSPACHHVHHPNSENRIAVTDVESNPEDSLHSKFGNEIDDSFETWVHPVTQQKFLINKHSGFAQYVNNEQRTAPIKSMTGPVFLSENPYKARPCTNDNSWIENLLGNWSNPIFQAAERNVHSVATEFSRPTTAFNLSPIDNRFLGTKLSKLRSSYLQTARVISQVDAKFILVEMKTDQHPCAGLSHENVVTHNSLVVIDQHAADERCKFEDLLREMLGDGYHSSDPNLDQEAKVHGLDLPTSIVFHVSRKESQLLQDHKAFFKDWGVQYDVQQVPNHKEKNGDTRVSVKTLPAVIYERCSAEPKLLLEMLRLEIWECEDVGKCRHLQTPARLFQKSNANGDLAEEERPSWLEEINNCPQLLVDLLISRSCRSAVMFNDRLDLQECQDLVRNLAKCALPFQCAHGRPSAVPLVDLDSICLGEFPSVCEDWLQPSRKEHTSLDPRSFASAYKNWRRTWG